MSRPADDTPVLDAARRAPPRVASPRRRAVCLLLIILCSAVFARTAASGISAEGPDFEYFYKGGAWLWHRGSLDPGYDITPEGQVAARGRLEWYLPFVARMMTLVAWLPQKAAGWIWLGLNVVALFVTLRLVGRHLVGRPPQDWPVSQAAPLLLLTVFWYWEYRLNQINNFTLLLLVASFVCWQQGRRLVAGLWLGLAVLIKVTPLLLVLWFALKRQYRTAAVAIATVLLAGPVADLIVFGPADAAECYQAWLHNAVSEGSHRGLILTQTEMDWRNQGMGAVLSRWLHPTNYALHWDNDPRWWAPGETATMNVVNLSRHTVGWIVTVVQGLSLVGLLWLARRPARALPVWSLRLEWALFLLAMLWFMPVMRAYHLIWLLPALALLSAAAHSVGLRHKWSICALVCMFGLIAVQLALRWTLPQAGGLLLWAVAMVALPTALMLRRLQRDPAAIPEDHYAPPHSAGVMLPSAGEQEAPAGVAPSHA